MLLTPNSGPISSVGNRFDRYGSETLIPTLSCIEEAEHWFDRKHGAVGICAQAGEALA
jgi:hypothetical protein